MSIEDLRKELVTKDVTLASFKQKTKDYVTKLREDHNAEVARLTNELTISNESLQALSNLPRSDKLEYESSLQHATNQHNAELEKMRLQLESSLALEQRQLKQKHDEMTLLGSLQDKLAQETAANGQLLKTISLLEIEKREREKNIAAAENGNGSTILHQQIASQQEDIRNLHDVHRTEVDKLTSLLESFTVAASTLEASSSASRQLAITLEMDHSIEVTRLANELANVNRTLMETQVEMTKLREGHAEEVSNLTKLLGEASMELQTLIASSLHLEESLKLSEEQGARHAGEGLGELIALRADLEGKNTALESLRVECVELQKLLELSEGSKASLQTVRSELLVQKEVSEWCIMCNFI